MIQKLAALHPLVRKGALGAAALALTSTLAGAHAHAQSCAAPRDTDGALEGVYGGAWGRDAALPPGSLLACHTYANFYTGNASTPPAYVTQAKRAIAYRYTTRDAAGRTVPATGLLLVPNTVPAINGGKAPLVAITTGTVGVADHCAQSTGLQNGPGFVGSSAGFYLSKGFTVVVVDYIGLGTQLGAADGDDHPYLEGESTGHVVLDALRAARQVPGGHYASNTAPVDPSWRAAVDGYSQGGSASQWAGLLWQHYAPELPLAGVIVGAPAIDIRKSIERIDTSIFRSLFGMMFRALTNATDPAARIAEATLLNDVLTAEGRELYHAMGSTCALDQGVQTILDVVFGGFKLADLVQDVDAFWAMPQVQAFITQNSVKPSGVLRFARPAVPVLGYHGMIDDVNPYHLHADVMLNDWGASLGGTTLGADAVIARKDYAFQPIAFSAHATSSGLPRNDTNLNLRYAPYEWLWDSLLKSPGLPPTTSIRNNPDLQSGQ